MRDEKGLFVKGNPGGPGRPSRAVEQDYLAALTEIVTLEHWQRIVRRAMNDAIKGNSIARAWLGDYLIGKPPQTINLNAGDTVLLKQLLAALETRGMAASAIFEAMLSELASVQNGEGSGDG